ncbi:3-deoxy-manno-octulosonate cytidylyltransferase [Bartonella bacilliformis Peru38]|uniref:3-deoxy-manno-octulosonate cytidylyltransferase n=2 Tax=Bartonella bacilliformis TaxID=774 RepID=KDSB_BARBK|nr:3-deoxy-manno-octulosonate cytidylyltransferase [Bartonella bacilliformis]A1UU32.1 RecName: Full=3-deoxy-manno-octulosonate cytidylyltransferase; AltName: Full=CMP-2-keto-3-deoxyoctulosonic acid synthase; Short=CKS; Short=CMP-KDO synthase [Bartonella bacilliformis KC583]ABM45531.1 3-deoxy-D-manno-octulosonate cytidylyltransferase [Bartonella bacilliformis KC583]AMG86217.1 3-deoxy-manno-octulosonate cytidylyltransferase [Bartonella bacilliformis]EKS43120.1 3-deoxy-manno-octulosonate cytidylyl
MTLKPLILIPARMGSTRLPEKVLAEISGKPMIVHVAERAKEAALGPTIIATDHDAIAQAVTAYGHEYVMTHTHHQSGSDRIYEALTRIDPEQRYNAILNVQGDLPTVTPNALISVLQLLKNNLTDIATLGAEIIEDNEKNNPNIVKIIGTPIAQNRLRALYFTRATAPYGNGPLYHHIGLYAYRRKALEKFVSLKPSTLEQREKLEQLRALENNMRIDVEIVDTALLGVDTHHDLEKVRKILA